MIVFEQAYIAKKTVTKEAAFALITNLFHLPQGMI